MLRPRFYANEQATSTDLDNAGSYYFSNVADLFNDWIYNGNTIILSGLVVTAQAPASGQVNIATGIASQGGFPIHVATQQVANILSGSPGTNTWGTGEASGSSPRIDIVVAQYATLDGNPQSRYVNDNGTIVSETLNTNQQTYYAVNVVHGTAATSPVAPAVPTGWFLLATVYVPANATTITSTDVTDNTPALKTSGGWLSNVSGGILSRNDGNANPELDTASGVLLKIGTSGASLLDNTTDGYLDVTGGANGSRFTDAALFEALATYNAGLTIPSGATLSGAGALNLGGTGAFGGTLSVAGATTLAALAATTGIFSGAVALNAGGTLAASQTLTNDGTISGGVVNPASGTVAGAWTTGALSATTVSASGQITSTVASGTAPFVVTSPTKVSNLNAALWAGTSGINSTLTGIGGTLGINLGNENTWTAAQTGNAGFVVPSGQTYGGAGSVNVGGTGTFGGLITANAGLSVNGSITLPYGISIETDTGPGFDMILGSGGSFRFTNTGSTGQNYIESIDGAGNSMPMVLSGPSAGPVSLSVIGSLDVSTTGTFGYASPPTVPSGTDLMVAGAATIGGAGTFDAGITNTGSLTQNGIAYMTPTGTATSSASYASQIIDLQRSYWDSSTSAAVTGTSSLYVDANGVLQWQNEAGTQVASVDQSGDATLAGYVQSKSYIASGSAVAPQLVADLNGSTYSGYQIYSSGFVINDVTGARWMAHNGSYRWNLAQETTTAGEFTDIIAFDTGAASAGVGTTTYLRSLLAQPLQFTGATAYQFDDVLEADGGVQLPGLNSIYWTSQATTVPSAVGLGNINISGGYNGVMLNGATFAGTGAIYAFLPTTGTGSPKVSIGDQGGSEGWIDASGNLKAAGAATIGGTVTAGGFSGENVINDADEASTSSTVGTTGTTTFVSWGVGSTVSAASSGRIVTFACATIAPIGTNPQITLYRSTAGIPANGSAPASGDVPVQEHVVLMTATAAAMVSFCYMDTGLTNNTTYYYYLSANDGATAGGATNDVSVVSLAI